MLSPAAQQSWSQNYSNATAPQMLTPAAQTAWLTKNANDTTAQQYTPPPTPPTAQLSGGASAAPVGPTAEQVAGPLASIAALHQTLINKNQQSNDEFQRAIDSYTAADAADNTAHDQSVQSNEKAYTGNNQAALLNAANASTGLRGVLASLHALGGSGTDIVNHLVGLAANSDTGASRQAFEGNAGTINEGWQKALRDEGQRRSDAQATLDNNTQNNSAVVDTSHQSILQTLASMYGPNSAKGNDYAAQAADLAGPIAATTRATVAPYVAPSSLFSPGATQSYLAGTKNLNVSTNGNTPAINSPGYNPTTKKDTLSGVA